MTPDAAVDRDGGPRPRPVVRVVVPTYRRPDRLPGIIAALEAQTLPPDAFEVVVVDDHSGDDTPRVLDRLAATTTLRLQHRSTPANGGPALARNTGWRDATTPYLAFLDDDTTPTPGWLAAGVAALDADPRLGVVQGRTGVPDGVDVTRLGDWWLWRQVTSASPHFEGCNIFYRRQALADTGGFDEDIRWWGEDTAAGWRVLDAGWHRGFAPDADAVHVVERRGWWWHVRNGWNERNVVRLAAAHPGFRAEAFWKPWAFRREDAAFAVGAAGLLVGLRWRPALALALPYAWWRRPSVRRASFLRLCVQIPTVDAARTAGHLAGAARHRVLIL